MIIKVVLLFLVFIGVLAMFGKLRFPGQTTLTNARCKQCGRIRIGKSPCPCRKKS